MTTIIGGMCWIGIIAFDDQLLRLFGADDILMPLAKEYLLPIKFVIPIYPFTQMLAAFLRNDNAPGIAAKAVLFGGIFNVAGEQNRVKETNKYGVMTAVAVSLLRGLFLCSVLVYFMPAVFGRNALWLVMVATELIVAIFAALSMRKK